jgi:SAM-dependent methyltransferase
MPRRSAKRSRRPRPRLASRADPYELYQKAVQEPEPDLHLVSRIFRHHYGRPPRLLREDFCGTGYAASTFVRLRPENRAFGVDLDPAPLAWGRRHNLAALAPKQRARVALLRGDVRQAGFERADATIAFNFSYFVFKTRRELRSYFESARRGLRRQGILVLDAYGGADAQRTGQELREVDGFDYIWDQHGFDPISHTANNYIHFRFRDGSRLRRAFHYDWRLWSLPEIQELLREAGFREVECYWEGTDRASGEGNSIFTRRSRAEDDPAWVAYIAARV